MPSIVVGIWVGSDVGRVPITVTVPKVFSEASAFCAEANGRATHAATQPVATRMPNPMDMFESPEPAEAGEK